MSAVRIVRVIAIVPAVLITGCLAGCTLSGGLCGKRLPTPTSAGLHTNNLVDLPSQIESQQAYDPYEVIASGERLLKAQRPPPSGPKRSILCLSGGGSLGAFTVGILCGWTEKGDRPNFDVVTGVSTGGLIAPFAFLGPAYDAKLRHLYTMSSTRDIYVLHPVRGIFSESLADNTPLARQIDRMLTPQMMLDLAVEHSKGRRLYIGTTESQGKRFVCWDIGEIACRGREEDRVLIKRIMLGSSSIPGFFPPSNIPVTVDGRPFIEKHVDGGVSFSMFLRPPYVSPRAAAQPGAKSLAGIDVFAIEAGKLYADPEIVRPWVVSIAAANIETLTYARARGDITRMWATCVISGMNFHLASIPETTPTPDDVTDFVPAEMQRLFRAGYEQVQSGLWRTMPPGVLPGEDPLVRSSTELSVWPRSPSAGQDVQPDWGAAGRRPH